jgi:hypothetical protein
MSRDEFLRNIKIKEFVNRYTFENMDTGSEEYAFWETHVVPSCIQDQKGSKLTCVFCGRQISSPGVMRRHYMEQHYDYIPDGIFGTKLLIECTQCNISFQRKNHLDTHLLSDLHHKNVRMIESKKLEDVKNPEKIERDYKSQKTIFFANCLVKENGQKNKGTDEVNSSNNLTLNETLSLLANDEVIENKHIPRTSTKLSSIFQINETLSQNEDEIGGTVKLENKRLENTTVKKDNVLRTMSFPRCNDKNVVKSLDKALSDVFFHNLSFQED